MILPYPFLFGISGGEVLILLLLVLLLFGPKKIPEIARMIGRGMNEVKKVQREINTEIHRYSSDIEREAREMESEVKKIPGDPPSKQAGSQSKHIEKDDVSGHEKVIDVPGNSASRHKQDVKPVKDGGESDPESHVDAGNNEDLPYPYNRDREE